MPQACVFVVLMAAVLAAGCIQPARAAPPELLLYHSFDGAFAAPDFSAAPVKVAASPAVGTGARGAFGKAAAFPAGAVGATVRVDLESPPPAAGWTLALFNCLVDKEVMTSPDRPFVGVLDQEGRPLLTVDVSGRVKVLDEAGAPLASMQCFDALYWIGGENIHLAFAYDADGAEGGVPRGKITAYWSARPYGCAYVDLGERRPTAILLGGDDVGGAADELHLFAGALPLRAIYELARPPRKDAVTLRRRIPEIAATEAARPAAARREAWRALTRKGQVFEAEAGQARGAVVSDANSVSAFGRAYLKMASSKGKQPEETAAATIRLSVTEAGEYALSLRYALARQVDLLWPVRRPEARTAWTHNYTTLKVLLNGQELGIVTLYPTGLYNGHAGDVEPWAWAPLANKAKLPAGTSTLELRQVGGLAEPLLDAVLLSEAPGPTPPHPRWIDQYRIPPAWWVASHQTSFRTGTRFDTYTVTLRNRTDEPYSAAIELEYDMLGEGQTASTRTRHIDLAPHQEKPLEIEFQTPARLAGSSGYLRVVLWNDDVSLPMEYRLWNYTPADGFDKQAHPTLVPAPDPAMQAQFREWLKTRDEKALSPELKKWAAGPDLSAAAPEYRALEHGAKVRLKMFRKPLLGEQLEMLDLWMNMTPEQAEEYLSDAAAEHHGYGTSWDKVNNKLTGVWHGTSRVVSTEPKMDVWRPGGDIDMVTACTVRGLHYETMRKEKKEVVNEGVWRREQDPDVFLALRLIRWATFVSEGNLKLCTPYPREAGIPILAEAYYLTGDERYAHKAVELAMVYARKYTLKTRQFFADLHREDRGWWGTRLGSRYMWEVGTGVHQILGVHLLDLCWNALRQAERDMLIHNLVRWGMYEATHGPLWDDPDKVAKVNREDMPPFIAFGRVAGDPGPARGLQDYFRQVNRMVLSDGIHICSIGSYGGVGTYIGFMQKLAALGVDVAKDNPALRNCFLNHNRFVHACGALQPMDDGGGGQNHLGLGAGFGSPSRQQYAWGYELFGDKLFPVMADFIQDVVANCARPRGTERPAKMEAFYGSGKYPLDELWPPVFVAEDKGMAMLRNRAAAHPCDWIEVLFDYGKYGGRFHGHPTKLSILTAFNGQVGSQDYGDLTRNAPENNNSWFKGGYSHNTVQVDFRGHRGAGSPVQIGELIAAGGDAQVQWIDAHSDRMFDGVYMRRTTFVTDAGIVDFYLCRSDKEHVYDWLYHNFGIATTETALSSTDLSKQGLLAFAQQARSAKTEGTIQVIWQDRPLTSPPRKGRTSLIGEDVFARLWALPASAATELVLFAGPTVTTINEEKQIDYAMLRRRAATTVFATVIEPWRASTGPKLKAVEKVPVLAGDRSVAEAEASAVKVTRQDGKVQVFLVNYSAGEKTVGRVSTAAGAACWTVNADGSATDLRPTGQKP